MFTLIIIICDCEMKTFNNGVCDCELAKGVNEEDLENLENLEEEEEDSEEETMYRFDNLLDSLGKTE